MCRACTLLKRTLKGTLEHVLDATCLEIRNSKSSRKLKMQDVFFLEVIQALVVRWDKILPVEFIAIVGMTMPPIHSQKGQFSKGMNNLLSTPGLSPFSTGTLLL